MFLPGLAEIKMLYEQLQSNRLFNNRRATRSVTEGLCVFFCGSLYINEKVQQIKHITMCVLCSFVCC